MLHLQEAYNRLQLPPIASNLDVFVKGGRMEHDAAVAQKWSFHASIVAAEVTIWIYRGVLRPEEKDDFITARMELTE